MDREISCLLAGPALASLVPSIPSMQNSSIVAGEHESSLSQHYICKCYTGCREIGIPSRSLKLASLIGEHAPTDSCYLAGDHDMHRDRLDVPFNLVGTQCCILRRCKRARFDTCRLNVCFCGRRQFLKLFFELLHRRHELESSRQALQRCRGPRKQAALSQPAKPIMRSLRPKT